MKKRFMKVTAVVLVALMSFTISASSIAWASPPPPPPYHHPHYHHRYYHDYYDDDTDWGTGAAIIGGTLILGGIFDGWFSGSHKTYPEKVGSITTKFTSQENQFYTLLVSNAPSGQRCFITYRNEGDLKIIQSVTKALYGEYLYMGTSYINGTPVAVVYRFSEVYQDEENSGKLQDFIAMDLISHLPRGEYTIPYKGKLYKSLNTVLTNYRKGFCRHDDGSSSMTLYIQ